MLITGEVGALKHTGEVRISEDIFDNGVAPLRVGIGHSIFQGMTGQTFHFG